jgi:hypothetical protein
VPGSQITTSVTVINSGLKGYQAISLTNFTASGLSAIAAGSTVEIAGAFFAFNVQESITAFSTITTATTGYIALTPSGTAGSQIVDAAWTATAPTWSESKQGWYASAASSVRVIGGGLKTATAAMEPKFLYHPGRQAFNQDLRTTDSPTFSAVNAARLNGLHQYRYSVASSSNVSIESIIGSLNTAYGETMPTGHVFAADGWFNDGIVASGYQHLMFTAFRINSASSLTIWFSSGSTSASSIADVNTSGRQIGLAMTSHNGVYRMTGVF